MDDEDDYDTILLPPELVPLLEHTLDALKEAGVDADEVRTLSKKIADVCGIIGDVECDTATIVGSLVTVLWTTLKASEAVVQTEGLSS